MSFKSVLPTLAPNSQTTYPRSLTPIRTFFVDRLGNPKLTRIGSAEVHEFLSWRRVHGPRGEDRSKHPLSNRTIEKDRAILHRLFALAERWELVERNPVAKTQAPKVTHRTPVLLKDDELEDLIEASVSDPMLHTYVVLLAETGMRCESEVLWLRWEDVELEGGFLWVDSGRHGRRTKSGKGRWVPLTPRARRALQNHFARFRLATYGGQRSPWVFHSTRTIRHYEAGARTTSLRRSFRAACERAETPEGFRAHDLRHRRVTSWLADGKSAVLVREALGHSDLRTTMGYSHLAREHLAVLVGEGDERAALEGLKA